jgi:hypothetical protein
MSRGEIRDSLAQRYKQILRGVYAKRENKNLNKGSVLVSFESLEAIRLALSCVLTRCQIAGSFERR